MSKGRPASTLWAVASVDPSAIRVKLRAMRKIRSVIVCLLLGLLPVLPTFASDLFVVETAVADEGAETRNVALSRLLADVLVRVSGNTGIAAQPAAKPLLAAAPSLVQQYRYRTATPADGEAIARFLWARFDQAGVERMMRAQGLPVWSQRPRVLFWLATEQRAQRALLDLESRPSAGNALRARADYRGMPLQLPLMDLQDQAQLTAADVWSDYQAGIRQASARYPHDMVVTGRLVARSGRKWTGSWTMIGRDSVQNFDTPAQTLDDTLAFAVDQVQNLLAARYAPMPGAGGNGGTTVRFSAVDALQAYGRLVAILDDTEVIAQVALRHVLDDAFYFTVRVRGDDSELQRALDGSARLSREPEVAGSSTAGQAQGAAASSVRSVPPADLHYRLLN
jgi:hypothetical protein